MVHPPLLGRLLLVPVVEDIIAPTWVAPDIEPEALIHIVTAAPGAIAVAVLGDDCMVIVMVLWAEWQLSQYPYCWLPLKLLLDTTGIAMAEITKINASKASTVFLVLNISTSKRNQMTASYP